MSDDFRSIPIDSTSAEQLAAEGLRLELVDTSDTAVFEPWLQAAIRGFHSARMSPELATAEVEGLSYRRTTGVWDDGQLDAAAPVATVNSWPTPLTVPGERTIDSWAISLVTVSPTHRRKGIARALLEAELRTAASAGMPMAMLTVSESTIYGRFGFAPAAMSADWTIDTRRVKWIGPDTSAGRLQFVSLEQARQDVAELHERNRLSSPGEIEVWPMRWDQLVGVVSSDKDLASKLRAVRFDDEFGTPQGIAIYQVKGGEEDFSAHTLDVHYLVSVTPAAYAGLWRFLFEVDLVTEVRAHLRSADEPFVWQLSDFRGVRSTPRDHQWLRILDVKAALEARTYSAPGRIGFAVSDQQGYAAGNWILDVAEDGSAEATPVADQLAPAAAVALSVNELSSLYLGGVSASTLVRAGRITEIQPHSALAVDRAFSSSNTPWLSVWY